VLLFQDTESVRSTGDMCDVKKPSGREVCERELKEYIKDSDLIRYPARKVVLRL
jgi:hypothetical protein